MIKPKIALLVVGIIASLYVSCNSAVNPNVNAQQNSIEQENLVDAILRRNYKRISATYPDFEVNVPNEIELTAVDGSTPDLANRSVILFIAPKEEIVNGAPTPGEFPEKFTMSRHQTDTQAKFSKTIDATGRFICLVGFATNGNFYVSGYSEVAVYPSGGDNLGDLTEHPNMFLDQDEIDDFKVRVQADQEPWKSAAARVLSRANNHLNENPPSVTDNGGGRDFATDSPYHCNSPNRVDYLKATTAQDAARTLALAWQLTGNDSYADKAIDFMYTWMLDPVKGMNPDPTNHGPVSQGCNKRGGSIEIWITMPGFFYAFDLLFHYSGWNAQMKEDVRDWTAAIIGDLWDNNHPCPPALNLPGECGTNSDLICPLDQLGTGNCVWSQDNDCNCNNWENWRLYMVSTGAVVTEDRFLLQYTIDRARTIVPIQIDEEGKLPFEIGRSTALSYSNYAFHAMILMAEIARHHNVDLYNYTQDNKGYRLVLDWLWYYVVNPSQWPYQQNGSFTDIDAGAYEISQSVWHDSNSLAVINHWGRPIWSDNWGVGHPSLTHAR